jgi:hypothetical protein
VNLFKLNLISLIIFPYLIRPFHFGIFIFLITLYKTKIKIKLNEKIFLFIILFFWYLSIIISMFIYEHFPLNYSLLYNFFPFFLFLISYFIIKNKNYTNSLLLNIAISISLLLSFFILIGYLKNDFFLLSYYISKSQIIGLERLGTIIAPFDNPNSNGLILSIQLAFNIYIIKNIKKKSILLFILTIILFIGLIGTFARTALGALFIYLILTNLRNKYFWYSLILMLIYVFFNFESFERIFTYYSTIFTFYEDYSFNQRFHYWGNIYEIITSNNLYLIFGFAGYKSYLIQEFGSTVIDSSLAYLILAHGVIIPFLILFYLLNLLRKQYILFAFFIMLIVMSITYPFLTEPRVCLYIGILLGFINSKENINVVK